MNSPKVPNIDSVLWVTVFHIHSNFRSESKAELRLEGGVEFWLERWNGAEFQPRGGVESGTAEVWDGVSSDIDTRRRLQVFQQTASCL